jgi:hypothetical protein
MKQEFPNSKLIFEPWVLYGANVRDEFIYQIKDRYDRDELTPDFMPCESATTDFITNSNNFNSGVKMPPDYTRDFSYSDTGNCQRSEVGESVNRSIAGLAAANGSWYNWFGRWGVGGKYTMPDFRSITEVYPRLKLVRCIPNWDNLNNVPLAYRSWNGSVYQSANGYISSDVMYSRHPKSGKLFAVFLTANGAIKLRAGEKVDSVRRVNGYFEEAEDGSADFDILGDEIRLKNGISIAVDSANGQVKGNGYIFTLSAGGSPKVTTGEATDVTSDAATLNGIVNASGLSTTAWFEYGVASGSYSSKSSTRTIGGSNDTAVNFSVSGLSTAATYYYRLAAQNSAGTSYGDEMSFTTPDTIGPNCSVTINNGDDYTRFASVTLDLSATDNVGVTGYYISSSSSAPLASSAGWTTVPATASFSASVSYTLSGGDGKKTVYVWYKDAAGNVSNTASDSITLDATNPLIAITSPTANAAYTSANDMISLGGSASDSTSGVSRVTWSSSRGGSGVASGTTSWSVSGIKLSGGDNVITVTARDEAGNTGIATITVSYGAAPKAITGSATNTTSDAAVLNGTANASGLSTTAWFEYGLRGGSYDNKSPVQSIGGSNDTAVTFRLGGLSTAATYYYRLVAQNDAGTSYGNEMSFTTLDTIAPNCSISINGGNSYTNTANVILTLSGSDNVGVTGYYLSAAPQAPLASDAGWVAVSSSASFSASVPYTLSGGDGSKTVYAWYKDAAGNVSNTASCSIILDATVPLVTITSPTRYPNYKTTSGAIDLGGNSSDVASGVTSVTWESDRGGSGAASGTTNWTISGISLMEGKNTITVTARDSANNVNTAMINIYLTTADTSAPLGSICINNDNTYTGAASVTLSLSATDDRGVTGYYLSAAPQAPLASDAGWVAISSSASFSASVPYTLSSGDGSKTVYVWYRDAAGNVSVTVNDSIVLDMTRPSVAITSPTTSDTYINKGNKINLGGNASDATSGVRRVTWRNNRGGNGVASGTASWSISGITLLRGENIITVTATDDAGNAMSDTITVTW